MKLEAALLTLRDAEPKLRARGIRHIGVFGSTARGERNDESDIDILVDFDPTAHVTVYDYVAVKDDISSLFAFKVDVIDNDGLKPDLRQSVARDIVYAF